MNPPGAPDLHAMDLAGDVTDAQWMRMLEAMDHGALDDAFATPDRGADVRPCDPVHVHSPCGEVPLPMIKPLQPPPWQVIQDQNVMIVTDINLWLQFY